MKTRLPCEYRKTPMARLPIEISKAQMNTNDTLEKQGIISVVLCRDTNRFAGWTCSLRRVGADTTHVGRGATIEAAIQDALGAPLSLHDLSGTCEVNIELG